MGTQNDLLTINERLNLALESAQQVAFDWHIPNDEVYFSGDLAEGFAWEAADPSQAWHSSTLPAIIHDDDKPNFYQQLRAALKDKSSSNPPIYRVELRLKDRHERWRWVHINGKVIERDQNGRALRLIGTCSDIDERKQAEKRIIRLRDLHIALRQINQAIMRMDRRAALFNEVCRIVVECGHFHALWIGVIDSENSLLIPASYHGGTLPQSPPQAISIGTDSTTAIDTVISTKQALICNDCADASLSQEWRPLLSESAAKSIAVFPFQQSKKIIGVFNFYANEKDFFDTPLIELLTEMAQDVSRALDNYKRSAQRRAMETALVKSERFKSAILTSALDCVISINHLGEIINFNQAAESTFGHRSQDVLGKDLAELIMPSESREEHRRGIAHFIATGESSVLNRRIEMTAMHADGSLFPVELAIVPIRIQEEPIFTAFIRDISELKQKQTILKESAMRYRQLIESSPEAILVHRQEKIVLINPTGVRLLGAQHATQLLGKNVYDFIHPDHRAIAYEHQEKQQAGTFSSPFLEQIWQRLDGSRFHAESASTALLYDGAPAVQSVLRDITERKQVEQLQLGQNHILNMVATGVALPQILNEIAYFIETHSAQGLCSILLLDETGTSLSNGAAPSLPASYNKLVNGFPIGACNGSCGTAAFRGEPVIVTNIATDPLWENWREYALQYDLKACSSWPIFGKNKKVLGSFALYFRDNIAPSARDLQLFEIATGLAGIAIESRAAEEKIRHLAHYDGLTALPNRFLLKEYLNTALHNAQQYGQQFSVLFLDLDEFKNINDSFGHDVGDRALQEIAARLLAALRKTDKIARMGGDEFIILIEGVSDPTHLATIAQKLLDQASSSFSIDEHACQLSASIGIAIYPDDGNNATALLKNADEAMYDAKHIGKNAYKFYSHKENKMALKRSV